MRIFIGTSSEAKRYADFTEVVLQKYGLQPVPWTDKTLWPGGNFLLETLYKIVETTDGAVFFMSPDDRTWYRGKQTGKPRDNLILEAGLFLAAYGRKRVAIVVPVEENKKGKTFKAELPTDLAGLTYSDFEVKKKQDLSQTELDQVLERIATTMKDRPLQSSEFGLTFQDPKLQPLLAHERVNVAHIISAPWTAIADTGIAELMRRPDVKQIDILVAYRINEVVREMRRFRTDVSARMRVCLADMFDESLNEIYLRKYGDDRRDKKYLQEGVVQSIRSVLLGEDHKEEEPKIRIENNQLRVDDLVHAPKATYEIYLTPYRLTFSYYRIDDIAWMIPLDSKKSKDPPPFAYSISQSRLPQLFDYYLKDEFESLISPKEAKCVYPRK